MSKGGENREHHKGRVSIRRAHPDHPHESGAATEVAMNRGGLTVGDLFQQGMWWADQWAMSEPGTTFFAVPNWSGQLPYRTVMPADFPARPLPASTEEHDRAERERLALWDYEAQQERRIAAALAETDALLLRVRIATGRQEQTLIMPEAA
jgi:hypothetical protein